MATENAELSLIEHCGKFIDARARAGIYGADIFTQFHEWKGEDIQAMRDGANFAVGYVYNRKM